MNHVFPFHSKSFKRSKAVPSPLSTSAHLRARARSRRHTYHLICPVQFHLDCLKCAFTLPSINVLGITVEFVASDGVDNWIRICSTLALEGLKSVVGEILFAAVDFLPAEHAAYR